MQKSIPDYKLRIIYPECPIQNLKLKSNGIIRFVTLSDILYLKADDNYTNCLLNDHTLFTKCQTLQSFELVLGNQFYRFHKSYIVNIKYIKEIDKRNHVVILNNGQILPFSRKKVKVLEEKMKINTA